MQFLLKAAGYLVSVLLVVLAVWTTSVHLFTPLNYIGGLGLLILALAFLPPMSAWLGRHWSRAHRVGWAMLGLTLILAAALATSGLRDGEAQMNDKDPEKAAAAVRWMRPAATLGVAEAMVNLGLSFERGSGVDQSDGKALYWYQRAADQGDAGGMAYLSDFNLSGRGSEHDLGKIEELARSALKAAPNDASIAVAVHNLARAYENGQHGAPKDDAKAAELYKLGADRGFDPSAIRLSVLREEGRGGPRDVKAAVELLQAPAAHNLPQAQFLLGLSLKCGEGVAQDRVRAKQLLDRVANSGDAHFAPLARNAMSWRCRP